MLTISQANFIDGLKSVVLHHDHDQQTKLKALKLLLFTAVLDDDLQRVRFALDNGARADWGLDPASKTLLANMGWTIPQIGPNPVLPDADSSLDQSLSSEEPYPHG